MTLQVTGEIVQSWRTKLLPDVKFLKWWAAFSQKK